jgi:hypothetical protein
MFHIIVADWRRFAWIHAVGWLLWIIVLLLSHSYLPEAHCPEGCPSDVMSTKLLFVSLLFGQTPLVLWVQLQGRGCYSHQRITDILPLSLYRLNLTRVLTGVLFLLVGAIPWTVTLLSWRRLGAPVEVWVPIFTALAMAWFLLFGLRNLFPRVLIPLLVPLVTIPGSERLLSAPLEWITWPATSLALGIVTVLLGAWVLRQPPPAWAR